MYIYEKKYQKYLNNRAKQTINEFRYGMSLKMQMVYEHMIVITRHLIAVC